MCYRSSRIRNFTSNCKEIPPRKKYGYFQCRKKGLLSPEYLTARLQFANQFKKLSTNFWAKGISFYLDGTSWVHKSNPASHAKTFRTRHGERRAKASNRRVAQREKKKVLGDI